MTKQIWGNSPAKFLRIMLYVRWQLSNLSLHFVRSNLQLATEQARQ